MGKPGYYVVSKRLKQAYEEGLLTGRQGSTGGRPVDDPAATDSSAQPLGGGSDSDRTVLDPIQHAELAASGLGDILFEDDTGPARRTRSHEIAQEPGDPVATLLHVTCARCHKLTHEGRVVSEEAERAGQGFDVAAALLPRLRRLRGRRACLVVVVDVADLDGSLPRAAIKSLLPQDANGVSREARPGDLLPFELVLAVNKVDTLPRVAKYPRIEACVRKRHRQAGLPAPAAVHLVSSTRAIGVAGLLKDLIRRVGHQGDIWVVGAQNAGKSSLLNALRWQAGTAAKTASLTAAALPGTTLGVVRVEGLPLQGSSRCYDMPGIPHPYQLTSRVSGPSAKLLLARNTALKPRTYLIGSGQTLLIGGVARLDVLSVPARTVYATVWASDMLPLHLGKTDTAGERLSRFVGKELVPPCSEAEARELGPLVPKEVSIVGDHWKHSTADVCIAGLGWVAFGMEGQVDLRVWLPAGVGTTSRDALMPDFAKRFERPGWSVNSKGLLSTIADLDARKGVKRSKPARTKQKAPAR